MLQNLKPLAPDKILQLSQIFNEDYRKEKLDLGIGVYKDDLGVTPIMNSVKKAEKATCEHQGLTYQASQLMGFFKKAKLSLRR